MASARITCPDCKSVLRPAKPVPDGKKVKCPKCGNTFTTPGFVEEVVEVVEAEEVEEQPRKKASAKKASEKKNKAAIKKAASPKPPPKKTAYEEEEEESGGIYAFVSSDQPKVEGEEEEEEERRPDINYAPDMSIKDLRGPAQEMVVKPSNLIMLVGGLSALSNLFLICWSFWPIIFSETVVDYYKVLERHYQGKEDKTALQRIKNYKEFKELKDQDLEIVQQANEEAITSFLADGFPPLGRLWMMGGFILILIYEGFAIIGAVKMQNLESRRWGIASSILMLFPPGSGGLSFLLALGVHFLEDMTGFLGDVTAFYMSIVSAVPYLASVYIGIISLKTLMNQKVIDGFEYVAD